MNTTQLECFMAVVEFLNFSKAAASVNMSQPAISHQINSLEDELGVKLFLRTNKSVRLTVEGATFISDAASILRIAESSKLRLSENRMVDRIRLGIGCHNQGELDIIPPVLIKLREKYPDFIPVLQLLPFKSLDNQLDENKIQVMTALNDLDDSRKTGQFAVLCSCEYGILYNPDNELSKREYISPEQISGCVILIDRPKCSDALSRRYNAMSAATNHIDYIVADGYENAFALAQANIGGAIVPLLPNLKLDGLKAVKLTNVPKSYLGLYTKAANRTAITEDFIKIAKKIYKDS